MMTRTLLSTTAFLLLLTNAAIAQSEESTSQDAAQEETTATKEEVTAEEKSAADEAAEVMYIELYGDAAPAYLTTTEAIDRLANMGYTGVHDLDVEWGRYEVEAYASDGNEVEIEFDPVTGAILDISDNWF